MKLIRVLLAVIIALTFTGCSKYKRVNNDMSVGKVNDMSGIFSKRYNVDYCGDKEWYRGAKNSYPAGKRVRLEYYMIAADTNYSFYLDDEELKFGYSEEKGYIIEFTMPEHDVTLRCETVNSMEYDPDIDNTDSSDENKSE